jgi:hypothetical protein
MLSTRFPAKINSKKYSAMAAHRIRSVDVFDSAGARLGPWISSPGLELGSKPLIISCLYQQWRITPDRVSNAPYSNQGPTTNDSVLKLLTTIV